MLRPQPLALLLATISAFTVAASIVPPLTSFDLQSCNVADFSTWTLNGRIDFTFSDDVDFATVNADTIRIADANSVVAVGEFSLRGTRTVQFQPVCPSHSLADSGLQPHGAYTIDLPGVGQGGPTVMSTGGVPLRLSHTIHFRTPNSTDPAILFADGEPGPPQPVIASDASQPNACHLEIGDDPLQRVYFAPRAVPDPELGAETPAGFRSPLNLYSDVGTHVAFVIQLDQAIDATSLHLNESTVRLEYETAPHVWHLLPHHVSSITNCTPTGASVRLVPVGILPQGRRVRAVLAPPFSDITGDTLATNVTVGTFPVGSANDPGTTNPGDGGDEALEDFNLGGNQPGSLEDTNAATNFPHALWGHDGKLTAGFGSFGGTGGPGGDFDWQVGDDSGNPLVTVILDTTFSVITNSTQTNTQTVINGVVDIRNFTIKPNGRLIIQGPNPCKVMASGTVAIQGQLLVRGSNNPGVQCFDCGNIVQLGASGQAGGGKGGAANWSTTRSTPIGEAGYGAFNTPGKGGGGGESGYSLGDENTRRPGGGGGGALGANVIYNRPNVPPPGTHPCPDQSSIGLDAERGFDGPSLGNGALHPPGIPAAGGNAGPGPFVDADPNNDFWGAMLTTTGQQIQGELAQPWAGAGGGGGGNACDTSTFPTNPPSVVGDEVGAGGGGGGGSLTIFALGDIVIGQSIANLGSGRIDASGGTGGGGENTNHLNHVGGGSGGGSGGHVVLQSASNIDFTRCKSTTNPPGGIYALGGQGGQGYLAQIADGGGGAQGGFMTTPWADALPPNAYPTTSTATPCSMLAGVPQGAPPNTINNSGTNTVGDFDPAHVVIGGGGDGGPGIIQLHVPSLANIKTPITPGEFVYKILKPPPIGTTLSNVNMIPAGHWNQLLPAFSRYSQSQSKWIALGAANVNPESPARDQVHFFFDGTTNGVVTTTGSGVSATVADLPAILSGAISAQPSTPYIAADQRTVVFAAAMLADDIYTRNAALLRRYDLRLTHAGNTYDFEVGTASYDEGLDQIRVTVTDSGMPLAQFALGDAVELRPRFFRVSTDGTNESLPESSQIKLEFQAAPENASIQPDEVNATPWVTDIGQLNLAPNHRFVRFRVTFDVGVNNQPLAPSTPVPSLEFFRMPFRF